MSVAICNISPVTFPQEIQEDQAPRLDMWTSTIQSRKKTAAKDDEPAYVHPLVRRSSSLLSQESLEVCTESLGSETGSDQYVDDDDEIDYLHFSSGEGTTTPSINEEQVEESEDESESESEVCVEEVRKKELATVNYHCSIGRRSPPRSFPPPLPSISSRVGPCFQMRPHRKDGRLVVEAVAVPSQNYLHSERQGGRLVLSFIQTEPNQKNSAHAAATVAAAVEEDREAAETEEDDDEEEVEVVDRGTVVEVKVSTQPQQQSGTKVHRSSIVINKFVSCTPPSDEIEDRTVAATADYINYPTTTMPKRTTTSTTTAAAAAVAASSLGTFPDDGTHRSSKLLFTSKRRNSEELLRDMRRCHQLRKPLFIWEPCCIATSSS